MPREDSGRTERREAVQVRMRSASREGEKVLGRSGMRRQVDGGEQRRARPQRADAEGPRGVRDLRSRLGESEKEGNGSAAK